MSRQSARGVRGQSLVEFALLLPVIIVFIAVIADFGVALNRRIVFSNAAREATRYASLGVNTNEADIKQVAVSKGQELFDADDVEVYWIDENGDGVVRSGEPVVVKINYSYDLPMISSVSSLFPGMDPPTINLSACADMALGQDVSGVTVTDGDEIPCQG